MNKEASDVSKRVEMTKKEIEQLKSDFQKLIDNNRREEIAAASRLTPPEPSKAIVPTAPSKHSPIAKGPAGKPVKVNNKSKDAVPKKERTYNITEAREFIKKQREKRAEQLKSLQSAGNTQIDLKKQRLKELHLKSLELVNKNVELKRERSKSRGRKDEVVPDRGGNFRDRSGSRNRQADHLTNKVCVSSKTKQNAGGDRPGRSRIRGVIEHPTKEVQEPTVKKPHLVKGGTQSSKTAPRKGTVNSQALTNTGPDNKDAAYNKVIPHTVTKSSSAKNETSSPVGNQSTFSSQPGNKNTFQPVTIFSQIPNTNSRQTSSSQELLGAMHSPIGGELVTTHSGTNTTVQSDTNLLQVPSTNTRKSFYATSQETMHTPVENLNDRSVPRISKVEQSLRIVFPTSRMPQKSVEFTNGTEIFQNQQNNPAEENMSVFKNITLRERERRAESVPIPKQSKETQTSVNKPQPMTWLPPSSSVPDPYNFINTVKQKLHFALNTSKVDVGVQSSFKDSSSNKQKDFAEIEDKLSISKGKETGRERDMGLLHSFASHKCSNLDLKVVDRLELLPITHSRKLFDDNNSESDTSKNIPDISTEASASDTKHSDILNLDRVKQLQLSQHTTSTNFNNRQESDKIYSSDFNSHRSKDTPLSFNTETMTKSSTTRSVTSKSKIMPSSTFTESLQSSKFEGKFLEPNTKKSSSNSSIESVLSIKSSTSQKKSQKSEYTIASIIEQHISNSVTHSIDKYSNMPETAELSVEKYIPDVTHSLNKLKNFSSVVEPGLHFPTTAVVENSSRDTDGSSKKYSNDFVSLLSRVSSGSDATAPINLENATKRHSIELQSSAALNSPKSNFNKSVSIDPPKSATSSFQLHDVRDSFEVQSPDCTKKGEDFSALEEPQLALVEKRKEDGKLTLDSRIMKNITLRPSNSSLVDHPNNDVNAIHLKFEAEVHLLNEFNDHLKRYTDVKQAFENYKNNGPKVLQNMDTQTSIVTRNSNTSILSSERRSSSFLSDDKKRRSSSFLSEDISSVPPVDRHDTSTSSRSRRNSTMITNNLSSSINFSRGSEVRDGDSNSTIDLNNLTVLLKQDSRDSEMSILNESRTSLSISNLENNCNVENVAGLSLNMFEQLIKDEDSRIEHLKFNVKIREQALLDRTRAELVWLDFQRKKFLETGQLEEATLLKRKQRGILLKHEQERNEIKKLQQMKKKEHEERRKNLKQQHSLFKSQLSTKAMLTKIKVNTPRERRHSGPVRVVQSCSESSFSRKSSAGEDIMSIISQSHSIIERTSQEVIESDQDKLALEAHPKPALELSNIQRSLLMREADLEKRRKTAQELLRWHQKLLDEERKISELEATVNSVIRTTPKSDSSAAQSGKYKFEGAQLNQLWRAMTGRKDDKFAINKVYIMSQAALDKLLNNARQKGSRRTTKSENVDKTHTSVLSISAHSANSGESDTATKSKNTSADYTSLFDPESVQEIIDSEGKTKISSISELISDFSKIEDEIFLLSKKSQQDIESLKGDESQNIKTDDCVQEQSLSRDGKISEESGSPNRISVEEIRTERKASSEEVQTEPPINTVSENVEIKSPTKDIMAETEDTKESSEEIETEARDSSTSSTLENAEESKNDTWKLSKVIEDIHVEENTPKSPITSLDCQSPLQKTFTVSGSEINDRVSEQLYETPDRRSSEIQSESSRFVNISEYLDKSSTDSSYISEECPSSPVVEKGETEQNEKGATSENSVEDYNLPKDSEKSENIVSIIKAVVDEIEGSGKSECSISRKIETVGSSDKTRPSEDVCSSVLEKVETSGQIGGDRVKTSDASEINQSSDKCENNFTNASSTSQETTVDTHESSAKNTTPEVSFSEKHSSSLVVENEERSKEFDENAISTETSIAPSEVSTLHTSCKANEEKNEVKPTVNAESVEIKSSSETIATETCRESEASSRGDLKKPSEEIEDQATSADVCSGVSSEVAPSESSSTLDQVEELSSEQVSPRDSAARKKDHSLTPPRVDVKKRVSEILDSSGTSRGDRSLRLQDIYVTAYDVISSPESGESSELSAASNFNHEAEELRKKELAIEREIKQLQQQQKEQLPYVFMREIPNKPPPPYTPPSSLSTPTISILPVSQRDIKEMTSYSSKVLAKAYRSNNIDNVKFSEKSFKFIATRNINKMCCEFLFNICREVTKEHYQQFEHIPEPSWLKLGKKLKLAEVKPLDVDGLEKHLNLKLRELFGFKATKINESTIVRWGRKKRDYVDEVLMEELLEEESEWTNFEKDELIVKCEIANDIMKLLVEESADLLGAIMKKKGYLY